MIFRRIVNQQQFPLLHRQRLRLKPSQRARQIIRSGIMRANHNGKIHIKGGCERNSKSRLLLPNAGKPDLVPVNIMLCHCIQFFHTDQEVDQSWYYRG